MDDKPLDHIAVAPPEPDEASKPKDNGGPGEKASTPSVRDAHDAGHHKALAEDPGHEDAKLEIGLDESFPSSDPPAVAAPGHGDPMPSSGFDEEAEKHAETR